MLFCFLAVLGLFSADGVASSSSRNLRPVYYRAPSLTFVAQFERQLNALEQSEVVGRDLIAKFDAILAEGKDPMDSRVYSNLQALRAFDDEIEANVVSTYESAVAQSEQDSGAALALELFHERLNHAAFGTDQESKLLRRAYTRVTQAIAEKNIVAHEAIQALAVSAHDDSVGAPINPVDESGEVFRFVVAVGAANQAKKSAGVANVYKPSSQSKGNITGNEAGIKSGSWALTFDDGPHVTHSPKVLEALLKRGFKATFFQLGSLVEKNPGLAKQIRDAGHELANHSWSHANLSAADGAKLKREITHSTEVESMVLGKKPMFFRNPYGAGSANGSDAREMIAQAGMIHVFWNVDSLDWKDKNPRSVADRTIAQMKIKGKGVVLFHDIQSHTGVASAYVMDWMKANGKKAMTMSGVLAQLNAGAEQEKK